MLEDEEKFIGPAMPIFADLGDGLMDFPIQGQEIPWCERTQCVRLFAVTPVSGREGQPGAPTSPACCIHTRH